MARDQHVKMKHELTEYDRSVILADADTLRAAAEVLGIWKPGLYNVAAELSDVERQLREFAADE